MLKMKTIKLIFVLLLTVSLANCSSNDDSTESTNHNPGIFSANNTATSSDGATIEWTESIDIDGDAVTYAIILEGQEIASGSSAQVYTFSDLESDTLYEGYIEARDGHGGTSRADFFFTTDPEVITLSVQYRDFIEGTGHVVVAYFEIPEDLEAVSYSLVVTDYSLNTIPATIGRTYSWTPDDVLPTGNNVGTGSSGLTEFSPGVYHANTHVSSVAVGSPALADLLDYYAAISGTAELTIVK